MPFTRRAVTGAIPLAAATSVLLPQVSAQAAAADPATQAGEVWPGVPFVRGVRGIVEEARADYRPGDHLRFLVDYDPLGPYFNYGHIVWANTATIRFDAEGVPQTKYGDTFYDHPVTFCRYALHLHDRVKRGERNLLPTLVTVVDRLLATQDSSGAYRYPFPYRVYGYDFPSGWASGMAQGVALSVLRRVYDLVPDRRYLASGNASVAFLTRMIGKGGVQTTLADLHPSLTGRTWIEEFATQPANYKLNGFLFCLFGLYDWWQRAPLLTTGSKTAVAGELFASGVESAARMLPYFNLPGFTALDARFVADPAVKIVTDPGYHRVHIYQTHALAQIASGDLADTFDYYSRLWRWYVGDVG